LVRLPEQCVLRASVRRHRRAQGDRSTLRSIRPKRATTSLAASVDPARDGGTGAPRSRIVWGFTEQDLGARRRATNLVEPKPSEAERSEGRLRPVGWGNGPAAT